MSFRKFGGLQYSAKHNSVSSYYNTSNNLQATIIGQPNTYIVVEGDLSGNFATNAAPSTQDNSFIQAAIQSAVQEALKNWKPNSTFTLLNGTPLTFDINGNLTQASYSSYIPTLNNIGTISLGSNVTGISYSAFQNLLNLTSITIPKTVTSMGDYMFINVPNLTSITVDSDNINYSSDSNGILFNKSKTLLIAYPAERTGGSYTIPNTVRTIGSGAFNTVSNIISLTIPTSVTSLGQGIFTNAAIQTIIFAPGSQLTSITAAAFAFAIGLKSINIPPSVQIIGDSAFQGAISLPSITIPPSIISIGTGAFQGAISLTSITIPSSVTRIGASAFQGATSLKSVIFAANSKNINIDITAFIDCLQIIDVTFENSDNLKSMGIYASNSPQDFYGALAIISGPALAPGQTTTFTLLDQTIKTVDIHGSLTKEVFEVLSSKYRLSTTSIIAISVGSHITSIGSSVFQTTPPKTLSNFTITIPITVTLIDSNAFQGATTLQSITVDSGNINYSSFDGVLFNKITNTLIGYPIGNPRPSYTTIPAYITSIGANAFQNAINLTSITIPKGVTSIDNTAFTGCSGLTMIIFESSTNLDILNAAVSGNQQYFRGTPNKVTISVETMITLKNTTTKYIDISEIPLMSSYNDISVSDIISVSVGSRVTTIGPSAFQTTPPNMSSLTSINIPYLVTSIDQMAFDSTSKLATITVNPDNNNNYSSLDGVLFNKNQTMLLAYPAGARASYFIPTTVTAIGAYAFAKASNLTSLTIPNIVNSLGQYIVSNASKLTTIDLGSCSSQLTSIGDYVFANATSLTSITIPNSVVSIGDNAFKNTTNLKSITIPTSVNNIENTAFTGSGLTAVIFYSIINLTTPKISIADNPQFFCGTTNKVNISIQLTTFTLTNGTTTPTITTIDISGKLLQSSYNNSAIFTPKNAIVSASVGSRVTIIGENAFSETSLISLNIPSSVTLIDSSAFTSTSSLTTITVYPGNNNYSSADGVLFNKITNTLIQYPTGNTRNLYTIPQFVTNIESNSFQNAIYLTSITVESGNNNYSSVDGVLFNKITNTLIQYPIGNTRISYTTMPTYVTSIVTNAFQNAINMTSITIPPSVTSIDNAAFTGSGLTTVMFENSSNFYTYFANYIIGVNNSFFGSGIVTISIQSTTFTLTDGTKKYLHIFGILTQTELPESNLTDIQTISLGSDVTGIGPNTSALLLNLTTITIPRTVISIDSTAFQGASKLTSITVDPTNNSYSSVDGVLFNNSNSLVAYPPGKTTVNSSYIIQDSVISIGDYAFQGVEYLKTLTFAPDSKLTSIGQKAFSTSSLETVMLDQCSKLISIGGYAFESSDLTLLTIPNKVTSLGQYIVKNASKLTTITFAGGSQLTRIGDYVFANVSNLTSINVPNTVISIGTNAFQGTTNLQSITMPASITSIDNTAFTGSGIKNVSFENASNFDAHFASLGYIIGVNNSFCGSGTVAISIKSTKFTLLDGTITSVDIQGTLTPASYNNIDPFKIVSVSFGTNVTSIGDGAFSSPASILTSITIPASVTSIGNYVFNAVSSLTTVTFAPGSLLNHIGNNAFAGSGITSITIPASVESIGEYAFNSATNLKTVTFAANSKLTSIGHSVFNTAISLESIEVPASVTTIGESAFLNSYNLKTVTFAADSKLTSIGVSAFNSTSKLEKIEIPNSVTSIGLLAFSNTPKLILVTFAANSKLTSIDQSSFASPGLKNVIFNSVTNLTTIGDTYGFSIGSGQSFFGASNVTISAVGVSLNTTPFKQYYYSTYFLPLTVSLDTTGYTRCDVLLVGGGGNAGNNAAYASGETAGIFFGGAGGGGGSASFTNILCNPLEGNKIQFNIEENDYFNHISRQLNNWKLKGNSLGCYLTTGNGRDGANITGSASTYSSKGGFAGGLVDGLPSGTVLTTHAGGDGTPNKFCDFPYLGDAIYGGNWGTYPLPLPGNADPLPVRGAPGAILPQFTPPSSQNGYGQSYQSISTPFNQIISYGPPLVFGSAQYNLYATNPGGAYVQVILYNP
jgi:hypothetical protein